MPESEVDILVKHSGSGYMPHWNKIEGQLDESKCLDFNNYFYKGQFPLIK